MRERRGTGRHNSPMKIRRILACAATLLELDRDSAVEDWRLPAHTVVFDRAVTLEHRITAV